jgi:hypothetical protein
MSALHKTSALIFYVIVTEANMRTIKSFMH